MFVTTDGIYGLDTIWISQSQANYQVFHVIANSDAYVALTPGVENTQEGYEVVFGADGNTVSYIRYLNSNDRVYSVETQGILGSQKTALWVRFDNGLIEAGTGQDVGAHTLLQWQDHNTAIQVKAMSFSTGENERGQWQVKEYDGKYYT